MPLINILSLSCNSAVLYFDNIIWTASSEFGTYRLCEQRRFRRACASAQSRQNLHCSLIQAVSQEEPSGRSLAPLNGWACAVKICHDGMLGDTNSLDGAHISGRLLLRNKLESGYPLTLSLTVDVWHASHLYVKTET